LSVTIANVSRVSPSLNDSNGDGLSSATIQVVVTDSFGASATATTTITVNNVAPTMPVSHRG